MKFLYSVSLRTLLVVPGVAVLLLSNAVLVVAFLLAGGGAVRLSIDDLHSQMAAGITAELDRYLVDATELNRANLTLVARGVVDLGNRVQRERFFSSQLGVHDHAAMNFVGLPSGEFYGARRTVEGRIEVVRNNADTGGASRYYSILPSGEAADFVVEFANFDPRVRPWYQAALDKGSSVFSPVYRHFVFDDLALTASLPLFDERDGLIAVFGVDVLLQRLGSFLNELGSHTDSAIFIVEAETGSLVANSRGLRNFSTAADGTVVRNTPDAFSDRSIGSVWRALTDAAGGWSPGAPSGGLETVRVTADGRITRAVPYRNGNLDWLIVLGISRERFLGPIYAVTGIAILSVLALFWILMIAARRVVSAILLPVDSLVAAASALSSRNWNVEIEARGSNEMAVLSRAFSVMSGEIRDLVVTLEDRVLERTRELEHANQTKDKFFAIIAHDLKGPIGAAHHLVEQLIEQRGCMDEAEFTEALTELGASNRHVFRLLENLLLWAQSERGTLPFVPGPMSLRNLTEECVALLRSAANQKEIALTAEVPDVLVTGDRDMMSLVLRNLVSNAVKFTPRGGSVRVLAERESDVACRVIVEDSGIGIPPNVADSLFSVTSRSRRGTDGERGSGLGLTIVTEFLHRHGTEPLVEPRPGGGTRISFCLSLVP